MEIKLNKLKGITLETANKYVPENIELSVTDEAIKEVLTNITIKENGTYTPDGENKGFDKVVVDIPDTNGSFDEGYNNALEKLTELEVNGNGEYLPIGDSIGFKRVLATGYLDTTDATASPEKILDGYTAYVNNEKIEGTIPKYTGESENAEIIASKLASLVDGTITELTEKDLAGITSLRQYAFAYATGLTSVVLPNTITNLSHYAFFSCSKLLNITLPNSITKINNATFQGCSSLTSIDIPTSVTEIGENAFNYCTSLTSVIIPDSVTTIGTSAFSSCNKLATAIIGKGLTNISNNAFYNCSSLTSIVIPNTVTNISQYVFYGCSNLTSVTFEENIRLIQISANMFSNCSKLTSVNIPNSVTTINSSAFNGCTNLVNLTIPANVESINGNALRIGSSTSKATIRMLPRPNGNPPTIQSNTFDTSKLQAIEIPESEISAYSSATQWSNLTSYFVPYQP